MEAQETSRPTLGPAMEKITMDYRNPWLPEPAKNHCYKVSEPTPEREGYPVTNSFHIIYNDKNYVLHRCWNVIHVSERSVTRGDPNGVTLKTPFYLESGHFGSTYGFDRWGNPLSIFTVWKLLWIFRKEINWK